MKKFTLLFLTLSSLTFAASTVIEGPNSSFETNVSNNTVSAGVNVNVSAVVTNEATELLITDSTGTPISDINFKHVLNPGDVTSQKERSLSTNLRVKGTALANYNPNSLETKFAIGDAPISLINSIDGSVLTSTLHTSKNGFDNNGAILDVVSTISGTANVGNYPTQTTTLTVIYKKTAVE